MTAQPGDIVGEYDLHIPAMGLQPPLTRRTEFEFFPDGHSVIRAEFGYPCYPYELVNVGSDKGFYSGPEPVKAIVPNVKISVPSPFVEPSVNFYMSSFPRTRSRSMIPSPSFSTAALPTRVLSST